jgi:sarcosine oxidase gamma subunit
MSAARWFATAISRSDGKVLIVGGAGAQAFLSSSELYDPASNSFAVGPSMSTARAALAATLLPNGGVLVVGGFDANNEGGVTDTDLLSP